MRNEAVPVAHLKVGDSVYWDGYYWRLTRIEEWSPESRNLYGVWHEKIPYHEPPNLNYAANRLRTALIWRLLPERKCKPCYDSDCECIFDSVE